LCRKGFRGILVPEPVWQRLERSAAVCTAMCPRDSVRSSALAL
jgi:hypothetical protein